jgi:hypothetical protein
MVICQSKVHHLRSLCQHSAFRFWAERSVSYRSNLDFAINGHRTLLDGMEAKHCSLRQIDDGSSHHAAEDTTVADSVGAACHVLNCELAVTCLRLSVYQTY